MTLELLKAGLQKLINDGQLVDEAKQAVAEIEEIQQRVGSNDAFTGECYILHADSVIDLLNLSTYNTFGKLFVECNGEVNFSDYEQKVRYMCACDCMTTSAIKVGYDVIKDLYSDNELLEYHNPDGSFKGE